MDTIILDDTKEEISEEKKKINSQFVNGRHTQINIFPNMINGLYWQIPLLHGTRVRTNINSNMDGQEKEEK